MSAGQTEHSTKIISYNLNLKTYLFILFYLLSFMNNDHNSVHIGNTGAQ